MGKFTKLDHARMLLLINELARLSQNGWRNAKPSDYLPLEAELRELLTRRCEKVKEVRA